MNKKYFLITCMMLTSCADSLSMHFLRSALRNTPPLLSRFSRAQAALKSKVFTYKPWRTPLFSPNLINYLRLSRKSLIPAGIFATTLYANQQNQPTTSSVWELRIKNKEVSRHDMIDAFVADCAKYRPHNAIIPNHNKNDQSARIATYNIHNWRDPYGRPNFDEIMATIKDVNADVMILQECSWFDRNRVIQALAQSGYVQVAFHPTIERAQKSIGNMIISKYPFKHSAAKAYCADYYDSFEQRNFIKTEIQLPNNKSVTLFGTHLDVWDATGKKCTQEIIELADFASNSKGNVLIGADFNAIRARDYQYKIEDKDVWNLLNKAHKKRTKFPASTSALEHLEQREFTDSFTRAGMQGPRFTVWSGTAVDFLYLNKDWDLPVKGSYVYYSAASDHLPVIMDVGLTK